MKQKLLNLWLLTVMIIVGSSGAWAYTPTLTADYTVPGYKLKTFYNISGTNVSSICPESGDFRFRGGGYGLFNYGSGNRGADLNIAVAANDILIFEFKDSQGRSVTINSVSNCTKGVLLLTIWDLMLQLLPLPSMLTLAVQDVLLLFSIWKKTTL